MNKFDNALIITDEVYNNGFFPLIPNFKKQGSAYILADGIHNDIVVNEYTTTKQIRQGKYKKLIEISTISYTKELTFKSLSKNTSFSFDVYVKIVLQIKNPITFYNNKNIDVDTYFNNLFSLDVEKITSKYSILDYDDMEAELTEKLSSYNNFDKSTGFEYQISVVDAEPNESAQFYVRKNDMHHLNAELNSKYSTKR